MADAASGVDPMTETVGGAREGGMELNGGGDGESTESGRE